MQFSIHEISEILGISQSTIRRYEERGLIRVERQKDNGFRKYSLQDLVQISIILSMQRQTYNTSQIIDSIKSKNMNLKAETTHQKLMNISRQIHMLELARACYQDQEKLERLMHTLNDVDYAYYDRPAMCIYPISENIESIKKNPYFYSVRNATDIYNRCRYCKLLKGDQMIPAFSTPDFVSDNNSGVIRLKATQAIVFPDYSGKTEMILDKINNILKLENKSVCDTITIMTVCWDESHQLISAVLVPVI